MVIKVSILYTLTLVLSPGSCSNPGCTSNIYCEGPLLHAIQMAKIYADPKTFVDMKMRFPEEEILTKFRDLVHSKGTAISTKDLEAFLRTNFDEVGREFEDWIPTDWVEEPNFIKALKNKEYQGWALDLNAMWKQLGRKIREDVLQQPGKYSTIWVPNPVIVPGGRFRTFHYWGSYWILQGLLRCEMYSTAKGMLENFIYLVRKYGMVPTGGKVYYLTRSQPPMLTPMVKLYMDATNDTLFLQQNINALDLELDYWMTERVKEVTVKKRQYTLATYRGGLNTPRPESYWFDVEAAQSFTTQEQKQAFYMELRAAAESGWEFSSRWFIRNGGRDGNLMDTKTSSIVPVDLNAILYWNIAILEEFHHQLDHSEVRRNYTKLKRKWLIAVQSVLWHEDLGIWLDYDLANSKRRNYFYPSNIFPLWTECYNTAKVQHVTKAVVKYLEREKILYKGGVPASRLKSGREWDFPNTWPPLQHVMIVALDSSGQEEARRYALALARRWMRCNYEMYTSTEAMYSKYNTTGVGGSIVAGEGMGGVQVGFGWTNGIILDLLYRFSNVEEDKLPEIMSSGCCNKVVVVVVLVLGVVGCVCW